MSTVKAEITSLLEERHEIAAGEDDDFSVADQTQLLATATSVYSLLTVLLAGVASISLVVGGIGIMNIMLVSVRERTREIGIRKAIGAQNRDILLQFLVEALVLSLLGGLIGIVVGLDRLGGDRRDRRLGIHVQPFDPRRCDGLQPRRRRRVRGVACPPGGPPQSHLGPSLRIGEPTHDRLPVPELPEQP